MHHLFPLPFYVLFLLFSLVRSYWVQTRVNGESVKHCDKYNIPPANSASFPDCRRQDPTVTVVHGKLDAARCSLVEVAGQTGLNQNPVGAAASFSIVSKDSFGNTRYVRRGVCANYKLGSSCLERVNSSQLPVRSSIVQSVSC